MITFLKAQGSSLLATAVDYIVTVGLVELLGMRPAASNALGLVAGGIVNFSVNRDWVFNQAGQEVRPQAIRYLIVWCGNWVLNTAGFYILACHMNWNYLLSKTVIALLVGWSYNYVLQKRYVFK